MKTEMKRVLVAYASRYGSTAEIAQRIGSRIGQDTTLGQPFEVVTLPAKEVASLDGFDAVVLGTAIIASKPLPDATAFMTRHSAEFAGKDFAVFIVGLTPVKETTKSRAEMNIALSTLENGAPGARFIDSAIFAGAITTKSLPFVLKLFVRLANVPIGDSRDWKAIEDWADKVARKLSREIVTA